MMNKVIAIASSLCLMLSGCGTRPATAYQTQPAATPSTFQVAPAAGGQQMQAPPPPAASGEDAPAASAETPVAAQPMEEDHDFLENVATGYVGPAILVVGTVVAAGLFFWGNTHWFKD